MRPCFDLYMKTVNDVTKLTGCNRFGDRLRLSWKTMKSTVGGYRGGKVNSRGETHREFNSSSRDENNEIVLDGAPRFGHLRNTERTCVLL